MDLRLSEVGGGAPFELWWEARGEDDIDATDDRASGTIDVRLEDGPSDDPPEVLEFEITC